MLSYYFQKWPNMKTTTNENYLRIILYAILITGCIERRLCVKQNVRRKHVSQTSIVWPWLLILLGLDSCIVLKSYTVITCRRDNDQRMHGMIGL